MPVERLSDPEGLRDVAGGKVIRTVDTDELLRCAKERALVLTRKEGAIMRAELFGPAEISVLAIGAVGLMLQDIMRGEIKAKDGKQAIEIARIALAISDKVTAAPGTAASSPGDTAMDRVAKVAQIHALNETLKARVHETMAADRASAGVSDGYDEDEWEFDDEPDAIPAVSRLRALPSA